MSIVEVMKNQFVCFSIFQLSTDFFMSFSRWTLHNFLQNIFIENSSEFHYTFSTLVSLLEKHFSKLEGH